MSLQERILAAAKDGDGAAVRELLGREPSLVGAVDLHRKTPLHLAAEHDHAEVAELLIEAGADVEAWTSWGATPLEWAGVLGSRRAGDVLRAHGARLTLASAAGLGLLDAVRDMHAGGAVSAAFVLACRNGHTDVARLLLDRGADVNTRGFFAATALHWAAIERPRRHGEVPPRRGRRPDAARRRVRRRRARLGSRGRARAGGRAAQPASRSRWLTSTRWIASSARRARFSFCGRRSIPSRR